LDLSDCLLDDLNSAVKKLKKQKKPNMTASSSKKKTPKRNQNLSPIVISPRKIPFSKPDTEQKEIQVSAESKDAVTQTELIVMVQSTLPP